MSPVLGRLNSDLTTTSSGILSPAAKVLNLLHQSGIYPVIYYHAYISSDAFYALCRQYSELSTSLAEEFIQQTAYPLDTTHSAPSNMKHMKGNSAHSAMGTNFFTLNVTVSPRTEGKPRTITIATNPVYRPQPSSRHGDEKKVLLLSGTTVGAGSNTGVILGIGGHIHRDDVNSLLVQERDNHTTHPVVPFSSYHAESISQQAYARPGRRGGRPPRETEDTQHQQHETAAAWYHSSDPALALAKEQDCPIRYCLFDSEHHIYFFKEIHLISADVILIEQLNSNYSEVEITHNLISGVGGSSGGAYAFMVYYQCQALKSLGRSYVIGNVINSATSGMLDAPAPPAPDGGGGGGTLLTNKFPEKSWRLQVQALVDCILGITHNPPAAISTAVALHAAIGNTMAGGTGAVAEKQKYVNSFHPLLRCEAIWSLVSWQNYHAPEKVHTPHTLMNRNTPLPEASQNHWPGLDGLLYCLFTLFIDPETQLPIPLKSSTSTRRSTGKGGNTVEETVHHAPDIATSQLRNQLLAGLASLHSQEGHSPWEVVETLMVFLEDVSTQTVDLGSKIGDYDDSYYHTVVWYALSKLRFDSIPVYPVRTKGRLSHSTSMPPNTEPIHPIYEIVEQAKQCLRQTFTLAKTATRIASNNVPTSTGADGGSVKIGLRYALPTLLANGMEIAGCLQCLVEMDIQFAQLVSSEKIVIHGNAHDGHGAAFGKEYFSNARNAPHTNSIFTKTSYHCYFLPPTMNLRCMYADEKISTGSTQINPTTGLSEAETIYYMTTPLIRLVAFECFIRLCIALNTCHQSTLRKQRDLQQSEATPEPSLLYIPCAIEALQYLLQHEPSSYVKTEACKVFLDSIRQLPPRSLCKHFSLASVYHTIGWSDPFAYTLPPIENFKNMSTYFLHASQTNLLGGAYRYRPTGLQVRDGIAQLTGNTNRIALDTFLNMMNRTCSFSQSARAALLLSWLYLFRNEVPKLLVIEGQSIESAWKEVLPNGLIDDAVHAPQHASKAVVKNMIEEYVLLEEVTYIRLLMLFSVFANVFFFFDCV
jgi:hypothetical protein